MTDKEKQERLENLIKLHNKIKENPYWLNFDQKSAQILYIWRNCINFATEF